MKKEKILKILVYAAGVISLYVYVSVMIPGLFNFSLKEKVSDEQEDYRYGELYYMSMIRHFREEGIPPHGPKYRYSEKQPSLEEADIYLFGDSFFDFTRPVSFPDLLADTLHKRVYFERGDRPLETLARNNFSNRKEKILIYESTERYIPFRFETPQPDTFDFSEKTGLWKKAAAIKTYVFERDLEKYYKLFLQRNYVTTGLFSLVATIKFDAFKYISDITPVYSLDRNIPWLFYFDQLNDENSSFYYQHSDKELNTYCNNIADLAEKLKENYNLKLVFMGIPTKYTIYHTVLNDDPYNNLLPRLYAGLEERGIPVISLYEDYVSSDALLYYGTDSHWTEAGLSIAIDNAVEVINRLN
ncbi:MAG: hypothetical protein V2B15_12440 [Bacteroidota bacterium]